MVPPASLATGKIRWQPFRRRRAWLVVCCLSAAIGLFGWRAFVVLRRPNVLLITLDTTRADRLGCYEYSPALTPALDALAAEGVLFERAYTPAPLTLPSHASMMTGLYPPEHGLLANGRGRLDDTIPTLAEIFRDAGYDTAAFIGSFVLDSKFGLERGFREYDDDMTNTDPAPDGLHRQRDGVWVVDSALAWLKRHRSQPFFCWVHLYDAHAPYLSQIEEFGDRFKDSPYDGGIAYVDQQVARLVKHLAANGLRKRTLIVVAGDHGESLGEHEEREHGLTLYNGVLRVPWIWTGRGATAVGRRVPQPVSLVDLRPTLLESVGLRDSHKASGRSLRAALAGGQIAPGDCYSVSDYPLLEHGWSPQRSLTTAAWKYIRSPQVELYDLSSDPQETRNLAAARPEQVQILEEQLAALERTMVLRHGSAVELSPSERRALESLGYLGGQGPRHKAAPSAEALPDVKQMLPVYNKVEAANQLRIDGDPPAAELRLRELIRETPDYLPARLYLAKALTQQKKLAESREVSQEVLQRDSENSEAHFELGSVSWERQEFAEAAEEFRKAVAAKANAYGALFSMAQALVQLGRTEDGEAAFREVLAQDPLYVSAHVALANLLAAQQRGAEAEAHYREALRYTPGSVEAHDRLAMLLVEQNRLAEAEAHLARAVELAPLNAALQFNHGTILVRMGRLEEALPAFEEALRLNPQDGNARMRLQQLRNRRGR
jgi:arylsulfatase A-like enzyme/Tfp pilus assembly protein PilF